MRRSATDELQYSANVSGVLGVLCTLFQGGGQHPELLATAAEVSANACTPASPPPSPCNH